MIFSEQDKRDMQDAADAINAIATVGGAWLMQILSGSPWRDHVYTRMQINRQLTMPLDWKEG